MRITIDLKIFLFAIIFAFTNQIEFYVVLMLYAIIHEVGHLLCGILLKFKPESFNITPFGLQINFYTELEEYNIKIKNGNKLCIKKMWLALAGPLTNFILVLLLIFTNKFWNVHNNIFLNEIAIYSNILIGLFNFIPIYPLDGGRILKEILHIYFGLKKAYAYVNKVSNITMIILLLVCSIIVLYVHNIAILIILAYLGYLVIKQNKSYNSHPFVHFNSDKE